MALFDFFTSDQERSRRFRQRIQSQQGFDQVAEARRRGTILAQAAELDEECNRLHSELQGAKADLATAQAIHRRSLIKQQGLVLVIAHLKEHWQPCDEAEANWKQDIKPFVQRMIDVVENDPKALAHIAQRIKEQAFPA